MIFGKKKIIGLDIGSSSIKVVELKISRKSVSLLSFGMIPTPLQATTAGEITDPQALAGAIQSVVTEVKTKRQDVATSLWGSTVIVKRISIPKMEANLIGEQIRWEAEQYIPYDVNEVNLGFEILKSVNKSSETMDILLVAAVQDSIFKCAETVEMAGLRCSVLDVGGFALANCFEQNYGIKKGRILILINIGASITNFVAIENGEVIFCRDIPVGGLTYNNELNKGMGISLDEAEALKISASIGQPVPEEAIKVITATHEIVYEEINNSLEFFLNTNNVTDVSKCYVTGGCTKVVGLLGVLSKQLNCDKFDPFIGVEYNSKVFSESYIDQIREFAAVSIGLGLRSPAK